MSAVGGGLRAALLAQDDEAVTAALGSCDVVVPAMTAGPDGPVALFEGTDGQRALYAFSDDETFTAWVGQVGDDGHHVRIAGRGLGELALDQGVDAVVLDPGPDALVVAPEALALSLAGDAGTVLESVDGVGPATGPAADAVAAALAAVLEWSPVRSAWLFAHAAGDDEVLTVAMAGVDLDGALRRCREATDAIPEGLPLDVIALDDAQEAWISAELPGSRLGRRGAQGDQAVPGPRSPDADDDSALTAALTARDQVAITAALLAGTVLLAQSSVDGEHRVDLFRAPDGSTTVNAFSTAALLAGWVERSGHEGDHRVVDGAGLGELLTVGGVDAVVFDAGAAHALGVPAAALAAVLTRPSTLG